MMLYYPFVLLLIISAVFSVIQCDIYRLPKSIKPVRYILTIEPHLESNLSEPIPYDGNIIIELEIIENTNSVTLHKKTFTIDNSTIAILNSSGAEIKPSSTLEDEETETDTIHLGNELVKGQHYNLSIGNFSGYLAKGEGFFLVKYSKKQSKIGAAAITHFEPSGARTAFPCFDEPALKANFIIKLIRRQGYNSVSNEELDNTEDLGNGRFMDTFKETPKMSSYLVAFAVSEFIPEKVERQRIFVRPGAVNEKQLNYSKEIVTKTLKILEEYIEIKFPLSKVDHFALPKETFYASAMENWGLIIYTEKLLFNIRDSQVLSEQEYLKRCTLLIVHEFVHQWFGNLVTPEWWDYIWLSESFAAYFQYYTASIVQPTWRLMDQFVVDVVHRAFRKEETKGAHPLNYHVQKSGTYPPFYIMYEKGSSILRMVESFLTSDVFRRGLQLYLEKKKFSNAVPSDLYAALQEAVNKKSVNNLLNNLTVAEIFEPWATNEGFPLVTVTRDYNSGGITLQQESGSSNWTIKGGIWKIPITYLFSSSNDTFSKTTADYWLTNESATVNNNFPTEGWLIINKQQTGYYRVNYDMENWERLIEFLNSDKFESLHLLNRAQLVDDSFSLAHDGKIPPDTPLRLCEYLVREVDYIPWAAFFQGVSRYIPIYLDREGGNIPAYLRQFAERTNLNSSSLGGFSIFAVRIIGPSRIVKGSKVRFLQEYVRNITGGIRGHFKAHNESEDDHLDNFARYRIKYYFPFDF